MVVVVGGVGTLAGAVVVGGGLGFLTKYIEPLLEDVYGKLAVLGLIVLFLQWRPSGLFPERGRLAED
jgi:urea transport system permease protein